MTLSYLEELGLIQQFSDEAAEVERRAAAVTPEDAERLTRAYTTNPYLNRQIMASVALAGMPEDKIRQIGDYATSKMVNAGITPYPDDLQEYIPQNRARQLVNNISLQIPGYGGSAMTPIGAEPTWIGEAASALVDGYQEVFDAVVPDAVSSTATSAAKGLIRTGLTIGESTGQFAQNRISQALQFADKKGYEWWDLRYTLDFLTHLGMFNEESKQGIVDAAKATDVGIAVQQYMDTGRVDLGSGYFPEGTVDAQQAAMQREVLGTLPGPGGQEYAYTPGRRLAKEFVDVGLMSHDNIVAQSISGLIDGSIKAVADATNLIGGVRIGRTAVSGARMPRNAARYNQLASEARQMALAGNDGQAVLKMREAQEAIGISVGRLSDDEVIQLFESTDEASVMLRGQLLDEAGIIREGDTVTVNLPETAKWLSSGSGRRVLDLISERNTPAQILDLFQDNMSPRLAKRLAETSDPVEIARILGAAYANPGSMLEDAVNIYPHVGVFNVRDKAATVRRAIGANVRAGKYLPEGSVLNPQNPTQFIHDFKVLANTLPLGAGRDGFRRFDPRLVDEYVNRFVDAFDSGVPGAVVDVVGDFEKDLVAMFNRLGYTMEEATSLTRWSANADRIGQYLMKDLAADSPQNVAEAGIAVYQDMLNSGVMVIDQERLQRVLRSTGRVKQILRNNPVTSAYARTSQRIDELSDKIDELLEAGKTEQASELGKRRERLRARQQQIVADTIEGKGPKDLVYWLQGSVDAADAARYYLKSSLIVRLAYVTRVLPDEIGRVMASGAFDDALDYFAAVASGGYRFDAQGLEFVATNVKWQKALDDVAELIEAQDIAARAGDDALALRYTNEILEKEAEIEFLRESFEAQREGLSRAMISRDRRRASETVMRERTRRSNASGVSKQVNRFSSSETELREWSEGLVQQIGRRSKDPVMSELARAMTGRQLTLNTPYEVNGVRGNLAEHVDAGRVANVEEGLAYWLFDGPGNQFWQDFVYTKSFTGTTYDVDSFDSVMLWVNQMSDEIAYITGGRTDLQGIAGPGINPRSRVARYDEELVEAIATGQFRDRPISTLTRNNNIETNAEAVRYAYDEFRQTANAPNNIIYRSRGAFGETPDNKYQQFINFFFGTLYGVPSDKLARSPLFRRIYWNAMSDLVRSADPQTAATIVKNAQKAKVSDSLMQKIIENSRANLADAPLENLDELAKGRALAEVKDLLFDASKRGAGADSLRFVVLFGDAWKEVFQTYGRLLINRRGKPALRVAQGIYAGTKTTVGGPGDIYGVNPLTGEPTVHPDGKPESVFYKDPVSGDMIFSLPFSRDVISWAADIPKSDAPALVAPLTGLNLAGSIFPGFGPVVDNLVNTLIPQSARFTGLREFLFPFGEPEGPQTAAGQQIGLETFVPGWLQKVATGFRSADAVGQLANYMSQAESNVGYQNARNHVARLLMNVQLRDIKRQQQEAGVAPEDVNNPMLVSNQAQFFDEVTRIADRIWLVRGIAQLVGPASPFLQWYADTNEGNVMVALMVDEMNKSMDEYVKQGMSPDLAVSDMLDKYGVEVFMASTALTESTLTGANASDEWFGYYLDNTDFIDSYPLIGAYFGPTGEFSVDARSSMISRGIYEVKSLEQQFEDAAFTLAYVAYNRERERYGSETTWAPQVTEYLAEYRAALENQFGIDMETFADRRRLQIGQLEQLLQDSFDGDPLAGDYMNSDLGIKIQEYLAYRQVVAAEADRRGTNWQGGKNAADLREIMRELGASLSENDPVFNRLYQFVFKGEMLREDVTPERPAIVPVR